MAVLVTGRGGGDRFYDAKKLYWVIPSCFIYSALSQNRCFSSMHPFFHLAIVAIGIWTFSPVGAVDCPVSSLRTFRFEYHSRRCEPL